MKHFKLTIVQIVVCCCFFANASILDDFERGTATNLYGGIWKAYADRDDGGNSSITNGTLIADTKNFFTVLPSEGNYGQGAGGKVLMMQYEFGSTKPRRGKDVWGQTVGMLTELSSIPDGCRDITGATFFTFRARSSSRVNVTFMVPIATVKDYAFHRVSVTIDTVWTQKAIPISSFRQPSDWGISRTFNLAAAQRLQWEITVDNNSGLKGGTLWLDSIEILNYDSNVPEIVSGLQTTFDLRPSFNWRPFPGASSYTIQIDTVPAFTSNYKIAMDVVDTFFVPLSDLTFAPMYWRVKTPATGFSITGCITVVDARIPVLIPIATPCIDRQPVFRWHHSHTPVSAYRIEIATSPTFTRTSIIDTATIAADTQFQSSKVLPLDSIFWRMKGDSSAYSQVQSFIVVDGRIPIPIPMINPCFTRRPVFTWHPTGLPVACCTLEVRHSYTLISKFAVTDTFFVYPVDIALTSNIWRVKGDNSEWSAPDTFDVISKDDLELIPIDTPTIDPLPVFRWKKPPVVISEYRIYIANNSSFSSSTTGSYSKSYIVLDTMFTCTDSLPAGPVYWRISAEGAVSSKTQSYTLLDYRIPWLIPVTPKVSSVQTPLLVWLKVKEASTYTIQIANNAAFNPVQITVPTQDTVFQVVAPLGVGNYFWRVKSDRIVTYSPVDSFTIQSDSIPLIKRYNGAEVHSRRPVFVWNRVSGATSYTLLVADDGTFVNASVYAVADTVGTPTVDLTYGKWYWKVSCDRDTGLYSPVDSVIVSPVVATLKGVRPGVFSVCITSKGISITTVNPLINKGVTIYDISGKLISRPHLQAGVTSFFVNYGSDGSVFSPGVYIIKIASESRTVRFRVVR